MHSYTMMIAIEMQVLNQYRAQEGLNEPISQKYLIQCPMQQLHGKHGLYGKQERSFSSTQKLQCRKKGIDNNPQLGLNKEILNRDISWLACSAAGELQQKKSVCSFNGLTNLKPVKLL